MRYRPDTLEDAKRMATRLDYETKDGGLGVDVCSECGEHVFVVEGSSIDGTVYHGYCMNPECHFERSVKDAENDAYAAR